MSIHTKIIAFLTPLLLSANAAPTRAQCTAQNTAFDAGEFIAYNLYYNWKFIWVKAGTASLSTVQSHYGGREAMRTSLITRGNDRADNFFVMRDTILTYFTPSLTPLYYRKGAREGKRYVVDEVLFRYDASGVQHLDLFRQKNSGERVKKSVTPDECAYDMLTMFFRIRSLDIASWNVGHEHLFPMAEGREVTVTKLIYKGKETVKGDNGKRYRCLVLSYMEPHDGGYKEIVRFYVTDDKNHIPVRLDMYLRFGAAKAFLTAAKGLRHESAAVVE